MVDHACRGISGLTDKNDHIHLRASNNGRHFDRVNLVTLEHVQQSSAVEDSVKLMSCLFSTQARIPVLSEHTADNPSSPIHSAVWKRWKSMVTIIQEGRIRTLSIQYLHYFILHPFQLYAARLSHQNPPWDSLPGPSQWLHA